MLSTILLFLTILNPFHWLTSPIDTAVKSTVMITGTMKKDDYVCSGFYIAPYEILTAAHCVGKDMKADDTKVIVVKEDDYYDLALLISPVKDHPLTIRDEPVYKDEPLIAMGYAFGWKSVATLHVSPIILNIPIDDSTPPGIIVQGQFIKGMSGGPVVDKNGEVVSIVQQGKDGIGYGVPSLLIKAFLLGTD